MLIASLLLAGADPVPPTAPADAAVQAAVRVVRDYYEALRRHDYGAAHSLWPSGPGVARLRRGYADTVWTRVTPLAPFATEGAAGSVYARIAVTVVALEEGGARRTYAGFYQLRRVDDVDGSSAAARRWHIVAGRLHAAAGRR